MLALDPLLAFAVLSLRKLILRLGFFAQTSLFCHKESQTDRL